MDKLKYGQSFVTIPSTLLEKAQILVQKVEPEPLQNYGEAITTALRQPTGCKPLAEMVSPQEKIAIVVSDITRPVPTSKILPPLLEELHSNGVTAENISIVFGLGIHRTMTEEEMALAIGEDILAKYNTVQPQKFVSLGETSRGTPIEVCKEVAQSDFIILTGNLEFHYFAGYTGGFKALMPGVSSKAAIEKNHKMMLEPAAAIGVADGNPVREDLEEFGRKFPRTFLLNVLLNTQKEITGVVAGDPVLAHRKGCEILDRSNKVYVEEAADLVIVSPGGFPKDINLYQAQKALENAAKVVKKGGKILLVAELKEGFGEDVFEDWLVNSGSIDEILMRIQEKFVLGGHKAAAIAKVLKENEILLLSTLPDDLVRKIFFTPVNDLAQLASDDFDKVYIIPYGSGTLPEVKNSAKDK